MLGIHVHSGNGMYEEHGGAQGSQRIQDTVCVHRESRAGRIPIGTDRREPRIPADTVKVGALERAKVQSLRHCLFFSRAPRGGDELCCRGFGGCGPLTHPYRHRSVGGTALSGRSAQKHAEAQGMIVVHGGTQNY